MWKNSDSSHEDLDVDSRNNKWVSSDTPSDRFFGRWRNNKVSCDGENGRWINKDVCLKDSFRNGSWK